MGRILVLGGGGFLGVPVTARLAAGVGDTVLLRGERSPGHDLTADLAGVSVDALARRLAALAPDAVVNCAGLVAGSASELCAVNARGPAVLAEAMAMAVPGARLVHLGSAAEYGPAAAGTALSEQSAARPVGVYGASKLAGTLAVTGSGLDAVVLRVFNPVGAGASRAGLPGRLAAAFRDAPPRGTVRTGSLAAYRDFVDVRDVAEAVALAAVAPGPLPPVVNIGSGRATRVRALAAELAEIAGFTGRIEESGAASPRSAAVDWHEADIALAVHVLGWHPTRTLRSALTSLWTAAAPPLSHPEDPPPSSKPAAFPTATALPSPPAPGPAGPAAWRVGGEDAPAEARATAPGGRTGQPATSGRASADGPPADGGTLPKAATKGCTGAAADTGPAEQAGGENGPAPEETRAAAPGGRTGQLPASGRASADGPPADGAAGRGDAQAVGGGSAGSGAGVR